MPVRFSTVELPWTCRHKRKIQRWLEGVVRDHGCELGEIEVVFCSDDYLLEVNRNSLNHNYFTDIITFDYRAGELISGDLFVSIDRVRDNAQNLGVSFSNELHRVLVHGVLHLCGWHDSTDEEKNAMRTEETRWLQLFPD